MISATQRLERSAGIIADSFPNVTVLPADLVGFTKRSLQVSPRAMVEMLNRTCSDFDQPVERHGFEKIKTTGDGYEVAAGAPIARPDHAAALSELALDMQSAIRALSQESGWPLDVCIGIDSRGPRGGRRHRGEEGRLRGVG